MPQLDFSTFLPQIFWLFISLSFLYIVLSRYALPRVSDVIEERKDIIAQDIDSAKKFSSETDLAIEELNMKLSEAKINSQSLMNDSLQKIKESNEEKKAILLKEINDDIVAAEAKILEKKEESLREISSVSEDIAIEMLENLSIGEIDKEKVNVYGGAVSMGHPLGSSGSRIVVTLISVLHQENGKIGAAAICNGGGGASSIIIQSV